MDYNVLKSLHLVSVLAWTAGLFYIGRIYVYYSESDHAITKQTLATMAVRLSRYITLPSSIISTLIGLHLSGMIQAFSQPWFHLKLTLILGLFGYQHFCAKINRQLKNQSFNKSSRWCRIFNEIPIILITGVVFAVITKNISHTLISMGIILGLLGIFFIISRKKN